MFNQQTVQPAYAVADAQNALLRSVYMWMFGGLLATGFVAMFVVNSPGLMQTIFQSGMVWVLFLVELGLVFWLSARVMKMSPGKATGIFLGYSALNGITLAPIAVVYTGASIGSAFITAAAMFGAMALWGYTTKRDLTGMGSFMMMGLIGIIVAAIVNIFMQSDMMSFIISVVGVIIFSGLTAYDTQKLKNLGAQVREGDDSFRRFAIIGALSLYLDFINLFISLLHLMGERR